LYPVMVGATGSNQTAKARSTATAFSFNASSNFLSAANVYVNTTTATGTASQPLQVSGGGYVSGNLGIGTTNPTTKLTVAGDVSVSGVITCTDLNSTSDINLKDNIETFTNALDIVNDLRGVRFEWKENHKPSIGVVAQELEEVLPELVNGSDPKTVNYNGLIGVLIEAIKEQQEQINIVKEEIKILKDNR